MYASQVSQCQAIHARSLFPCQDTPDVKSTFSFRLRSPLPVVASGLIQGSEDVAGSSDKVYTFKQGVPIPSYLFAVASGDLGSASVGPRSTVWTGPDELKAAKWELEADMESYIKIAESLVFPYAWGTYNVLVLPPSFPYGGWVISVLPESLLLTAPTAWKIQSTLSQPLRSSLVTGKMSMLLLTSCHTAGAVISYQMHPGR